MAPPSEFLGLIPSWILVYVATFGCFGAAASFLYIRMFKPILQGKPSQRTDQLPKRIMGAIHICWGRKKFFKAQI